MRAQPAKGVFIFVARFTWFIWSGPKKKSSPGPLSIHIGIFTPNLKKPKDTGICSQSDWPDFISYIL